jgi:hypothetical protein
MSSPSDRDVVSAIGRRFFSRLETMLDEEQRGPRELDVLRRDAMKLATTTANPLVSISVGYTQLVEITTLSPFGRPIQLETPGFFVTFEYEGQKRAVAVLGDGVYLGERP